MLQKVTLSCLTPVVFGIFSSTAQAQQNSPVKTSNAYIIYQNCRQNALKNNSTPQKRQRLRKALEDCRKQTPQAFEYEQCKKEALTRHRSDIRKASQALATCREIMAAKSFIARDKLPLNRVGERLFFAGIDLNEKVPLAQLRVKSPGFDCTALRETMSSKREPEFILFGNRPESFAVDRWHAARTKAFKLALARQQPRQADSKNAHKNIPGIGRVFTATGQNAVFFPTASCTYMKKKGRFYDGLKIYYLIDKKKNEVWPFFGLSFYQRMDSVADQAFIVAGLKRELGTSFREFATQRGAEYLVENEIDEFDEEDDPFDICRTPRGHKTVAVIKQKQSNSKKTMLMVVANIENLCKFGDDTFSRWRASAIKNENKRKKKKS